MTSGNKFDFYLEMSAFEYGKYGNPEFFYFMAKTALKDVNYPQSSDMIDTIVFDFKSHRFQYLLCDLASKINEAAGLKIPNSVFFVNQGLDTDAGMEKLRIMYEEVGGGCPCCLVKADWEEDLSKETIRERVADAEGRYLLLLPLAEKLRDVMKDKESSHDKGAKKKKKEKSSNDNVLEGGKLASNFAIEVDMENMRVSYNERNFLKNPVKSNNSDSQKKGDSVGNFLKKGFLLKKEEQTKMTSTIGEKKKKKDEKFGGPGKSKDLGIPLPPLKDEKIHGGGAVRPGDKKDQLICWNCHAPDQLLRCGGCDRGLYCDEGCQAQDWGRHQRYCLKVKLQMNRQEVD